MWPFLLMILLIMGSSKRRRGKPEAPLVPAESSKGHQEVSTFSLNVRDSQSVETVNDVGAGWWKRSMDRLLWLKILKRLLHDCHEA